MEIQKLKKLRQTRLRYWIDTHFDKNVTQFAASIKKEQSQIADMLQPDGKKSFGEKVARSIESLAKMPERFLDDETIRLDGSYIDGGVREPRSLYHGVSLTRAGALLASEWEKLDVSDRAEIEAEILARVAKSVRASRKKPNKPHDPAPEN